MKLGRLGKIDWRLVRKVMADAFDWRRLLFFLPFGIMGACVTLPSKGSFWTSWGLNAVTWTLGMYSCYTLGKASAFKYAFKCQDETLRHMIDNIGLSAMLSGVKQMIAEDDDEESDKVN